MKFALVLAVLGFTTCHVPNIVAGIGPGGMQGMFDRKDAQSRSKD